MPKLTVNGENHQVDGVGTIAELLDLLSVNGQNLVVELNGQVLPPERYPEQPVRDGDELELVRFVGGG
jgi:sulfur carrier protein